MSYYPEFFRVCCLAAMMVGALGLWADESAPEQKPEQPAAEAAKAPPTETVKKELLKITVELEGVFEAQNAHEILLTPEEWSALTVRKVVSHGAVVRKGDVLLELDTEKLDRAIADLQAELRLAEIALRQTEEQLQAAAKAAPMDLEAGERSARLAEEDRKYYFDVEKPTGLRRAAYNLKAAEEALEYQEEELKQLEKMYRADEITEETEEIVLRRARNAVDRARFQLELARISYEYEMKFGVPRRDVEVNERARRAAMEWEKMREQIPLGLQKQRLELERMRTQRAQSEERLQRLVADREKMVVRSPAEGVVYYGEPVRGRPSEATALADMLRPFGSVPPHQVLMTVVELRPLFVRTSVPERNLYDLLPGVRGVALPAGFPQLVLPVELDQVGDVPLGPGTFDGRLRIALSEVPKTLMPGMNCKLKLISYLKRDALCIPLKALVVDEPELGKTSVRVLEPDGKVSLRTVTVGRKTEERAEILAGLSEGDKVLLEPPK